MSEFVPRDTYKALLWDYDFLVAQGDEECCFSLSRREVQIILAQIDLIGWKTRYKPTSTEIDPLVILRWQGNLARKLMSGCCPDDERLSRFTETGVFQTSDDGGETWQDNPGADPRNNGTQSPPLPGSGDSVRCAAADNARDQYLAMRDQLIDLLTAGTTVIAIVAGIAGFIGVILSLSAAATAIGVLLIGFAAAALSLTPASVEAQISEAVLNQFRCILYCNMEPTGQLTYAEWQQVLADIDTTFTGFPNTFFKSITQSMGYIGVSNAGTMGVATASDCSGCDCECGGETVGLTMDLFFGADPEQTGCNVKGTSLSDAGGQTVSWNWDGSHPFKITVEALVFGDTGTSTWQWYLADGSGPFSGPTAPLNISLQTCNLHGVGGTTFRVSWDVATP